VIRRIYRTLQENASQREDISELHADAATAPRA
jgi:hypothetical protein